MADKNKTSKDIERDNKLDSYKNDRHNVNAREATALEPEIPRINTENL
ncbi:hypothetical protein [Neobacillus rhizophilus]|uniref:Uncharacterized protein n=1 Tax=Neobacillus rhizophilus TaxID=2833579 RepID=A0A942U7K0_9BACI|nr:hypothetical protein [Neobacillus rhizophilus]MBS4212379.1 hypothetical protein [Neobacillus rhizophilus]